MGGKDFTLFHPYFTMSSIDYSNIGTVGKC